MPPSPDFQLDEDSGNKVLHITLKISENVSLMGSDMPPQMGQVNFGNSCHVSANSTNQAVEAQRIFDSLSQNGKITMPFADTFWGAKYGQVTDKFGIN
jgi:PhnB protein